MYRERKGNRAPPYHVGLCFRRIIASRSDPTDWGACSPRVTTGSWNICPVF
jgi:hypothetical protein